MGDVIEAPRAELRRLEAEDAKLARQFDQAHQDGGEMLCSEIMVERRDIGQRIAALRQALGSGGDGEKDGLAR
jgi:hypothetical protein